MGGDAGIAVVEAFRREASIALELIIKAHVATQIELGIGPKNHTKPPPIHDVVQLWNMAGLPCLSPDDEIILILVKSLLEWSGRYAAPKDDAQLKKEQDAEDAAYRKTNRNQRFRRYPKLSWECFNRLYKIVTAERAKLTRDQFGC